MERRYQLSRRAFSLALGSAMVTPLSGWPLRVKTSDPSIFIPEILEMNQSPGFAAAVVAGNKTLWSGGYGLADFHQKKVMSADTLMNIGSISKTVTATAIMQLWEAGRFQLDDDVAGYLPFKVRNPRFPDTPITFRQLLTHRSSIKDGPAYSASYACGDPTVQLDAWIKGYFTVDGKYYDPKANFHTWEPGTLTPPDDPYAYSNVGFGLLGNLVEHLASMPFNDYCRENIFMPLDMVRTGWMLNRVDSSQHAVPHTLIQEGRELPADRSIKSLLPADNATPDMLTPGSYFPHCLYSFYNYPDGLLRSTVSELSNFLRAYINGGTLNGQRILKPETINLMLSNQHFSRGLCWTTRELSSGEKLWGHGGGDPGISTYMGFRKRDNVGVVVFYNYSNPGESNEKILQGLLQWGALVTKG